MSQHRRQAQGGKHSNAHLELDAQVAMLTWALADRHALPPHHLDCVWCDNLSGCIADNMKPDLGCMQASITAVGSRQQAHSSAALLSELLLQGAAVASAKLIQTPPTSSTGILMGEPSRCCSCTVVPDSASTSGSRCV